MTDQEAIKAKLEEKLRALIIRAEALDEELDKPPDDDWDDSAVESEDDEVMEKVGHLALAEIRQVKTALARIAEGTYGVCASCGTRIVEARLRAIPFATTCVKCAGRMA